MHHVGILYDQFMMHGQRNIKFYDLFSQIVCLKKTKSKREFFCFNPASGTLHEDLRMFHFCLRHNFAIRTLLCSTQYFDTVYSDMYLNIVHRMFCFHCKSGYANAPPRYIIVHYLVINLF